MRNPSRHHPLQGRRNSPAGRALVLALTLLMTWSAQAVNLVVNGSFTSGVTGWETVSTVAGTGQSAVLSDQGGGRVVLFQTVEAPENTVALRLSFDFFQALSPLAVLGQTPDSVFISSFHGSVPFGSEFGTGVYDEALGVLDTDFRGPVNFAPGMTSETVAGRPGWTRFHVPLPVARFTTVAFEFIDGNAVTGDSTSAVDDVVLEATVIPEPGAALLLPAVALAALLRRRRTTAKSVRMSRAWRLCMLALGLALTSPSAQAQQQPSRLEPGLVRATATSERSTLNRTSGVLTSVVNLDATNISGRRIDGPVLALIGFTAPDGSPLTSGVTVTGAQGGFAQEPWGLPFFDLTSSAGGDAWQPGETLRFTLTFSRAGALSALYVVNFAGRVNQDPVVDAGGPYTGKVGEPVVFSGAATDADGDTLTFSWDFGEGENAATAQALHPFAAAGAHDVTLTVDDGRGGVVSRDVTALIIPPGDFAIAHTRVVDGTGHPLGGAATRVEETGPSGAREFAAEETGFVSLGAAGGDYMWKFSAPGHLPVWRKAALTAGGIRRLPSPWLPQRAAPVPVSVLGATTLTAGTPGAAPEQARLVFPEGAFAQQGDARLTLLGPQTLPFPLPFGWSPLAAIHLELPDAPTAPGSLRLISSEAPVAGEALTLARFDEAALVWKVVGGALPDGGAFPFSISEGGSYALLAGDSGTGAPVPSLAGDDLRPGTAQDLTATVTAIGAVRPEERAASLDPVAVTAEGEVVFTPSAEPLPSASWFRLAVRETYDLADGGALRTPDYDTTVYAYRRPAATGAAAAFTNPAARFPLRPRILFGPADLLHADLHVDVLPPLGEGFGVLSADGGVLQSGGLRVTVPPGVLGAVSAGSMRTLDPAGFARLAGPDATAVAAFEFNLAGLAPGARLQLDSSAAEAPDSHFILARLISSAGGSGLGPVQRLRSDAQGALSDAEPPTGPRLAGLSGPGQYVLVRLNAPQGLITGTVRSGAAPVEGIAVRVPGQPWLALTGTEGAYRLTAPEGPGSVLVGHPTNGDGATASLVMPEDLAAQTVDLTLGPLAPRVLAVTPPEGAVKVSPVAPVTVTFSEKIAPASLGATPLILRDLDAAADVLGSVTLDLANLTLTFLPASPLASGARHQLTISSALTDAQGLTLAGPSVFNFTTAAPAARGEGAQLVIYEPGGGGPTAADQALIDAIPGYTPGTDANKVVAIGGPGTADPEVPVILLDETTGATATVLSKADGGFANFVEAGPDDFISAVFVNTNGTRISIAASKQKFDDGRVGLFRQGGILEAESDAGPVEVTVDPESIPERVRFELKPLNLTTVLTSLGGALPEDAQPLGAISVAHDADQELSEAAHISVPLDRASLRLPPGITRAEDATFLLTRAFETLDGDVVYEVLDTMKVEGDRLVTKSPPYTGLIFKKLLTEIKKRTPSFKALKNSNKILGALGLPGIQETVTHQLLLPFMMITGGTTSDLIGSVKAVRLDANGDPTGVPVPVPGATVAFSRAPVSTGRLRPGELVVSSREPNGFYAFRADVTLEGTGFVLRATHPRFPNSVALKAGAIGNLAQRFSNGAIPNLDIHVNDLMFLIPSAQSADLGADDVPARISASHTPGSPAVGIAEDSPGAALLAAAVDDRQLRELSVVFQQGTRADGTPMSAADVLIERQAVVTETITRREERWRVRSARAGRVIIALSASDAGGNLTTSAHVVDFARAPLTPPGSNPEDTNPPRVLATWPPHNAVGLAPFPELRILFSEPLPEEALATDALDWVIFGSGHTVASLTPSADRKEVTVRFSGVNTGGVDLVIGSPLADAAGNAFDQNPGMEGAQSFALHFELAALPDATSLGLVSGGGVVGSGARLFSLDRGGSGGLACHDVSDPLNPVLLGTLGLPDRPSDLVFVPDYTMAAAPGQQPATRDLVIATGGTNGTGAPGEATSAFKWLWVIDVTDASRPVRLASGNISNDPTSLVVKVAASPPLLAFQMMAGDVTSVHFVDLPAFVLGHNATAAQAANFPEVYTPGTDLNNDGDFADGGEISSQPARSGATFYGEFFSFAPLQSRDRVVDFALSVKGGLFGITRHMDTGIVWLRNLVSTDPLDETSASLSLGTGEAKRVFVMTDVALRIGGTNRLLDLALVSFTPSGGAAARLVVADISDPVNPRLLGEMPLPADAGIPQSIGSRGDGRLALAMSSDVLVLDPARLLETGPGGVSAAIVQRITGAGSGARSFVSTAGGVHAVALGNRSSVSFTGPAFQIVTFNQAPVTAASIALMAEDAKFALLGSAVPAELLRGAGVTFQQPPAAAGDPPPPPRPSAPLAQDHYYVLMHAPAGAANTGDQAAATSLPLLLATTGFNGQTATPRNGDVLSSTLIDSATTATLAGELAPAPAFPLELRAHQLSARPGSPLHATWLAGPFTLHGALTAAQARALQNQLPRALLKADRRLIAGLPPAGGAAFLDAFRARTAEDRLLPGTGVNVPVDHHRNPLIFVPGVMASGLKKDSLGPAFDLWVPVANALINALTFFAPLDALVPPQQGGSGDLFATDVLRDILLGKVDIQGAFLTHLREELGYTEYKWDRHSDEVNEAGMRLESADNGKPNWDSLADGADLFVFPYDWRRDNAVTAEKLALYVDLILAANPQTQQVDIVAHSMGGLVSRRYMLDHPGVVENFISANSPYLGATKAMATMATGDLGELALNILIPQDLSERIARNMPALHQLMPNCGLFDLGFRPLREEGWDLNGNGNAFEKLDYEGYKTAADGELFRDFRQGHEPAFPRPILTHGEPFHQPAQYDWSGDRSDTRVYHIVSVQQMPRTAGIIDIVPEIAPGPPRPDIGLSFPHVRFSEAEITGTDLPITDPDAGDLPVKSGNHRLQRGVRVHLAAGDGTVPLLSQTRGYGSARDLNAPEAVMAAIVSTSPSHKEDKAVSHVDVLHHPGFLKTLDRILTGGLVKSELPSLTITAVDPDEGQPMSFSVDVGGTVPPGESPVIVWETGDGRTVNQSSGSHIYADSGTYTLTCAVYYPESAIGTVASKVIHVRNTPPVITLTATPPNPGLGEPVTLRVDRSDSGFGDEHKYEWTVDGAPAPGISASSFLTTFTHEVPGRHTVGVKVTDDEGAAATAATSYTVAAAPGPLPLSALNNTALLAEPTESDPVERMEVTITGHDTSSLLGAVVLQDGGLLKNTVLGLAMDFRAIVRDVASEGSESLTILREPVAGSGVPAQCTIRATAATEEVEIRVRHIAPSGEVSSYFWQVATSPGSLVSLELPWALLPALPADTLAGRTSPTAVLARATDVRAGDAPAVLLSRNSADGSSTLGSVDRISDNDPTLPDEEPIAFVDVRPGDDPDTVGFDESITLEGAPVTVLTSRSIPDATLPSGAPVMMPTDSQDETTIEDAPVPPAAPGDKLTQADVTEIQSAIRQAFIDSKPALLLFVINFDDLLILEQGTGAALWKGDLNKIAYKKGSSDNDLEIFLPVFHDGVVRLRDEPPLSLDYNSAQQQTAFTRQAHTPDYMSGDWYFKSPVGVDAGGEEMGPLPDREDEDAFNEYVFIARAWRYTLPEGVTLAGNGGAAHLDIPKGNTVGALPVFAGPATPAEYIVACLQDTVKTNSALRKVLPDVSFFPYRREHFFFATPSVERPPGFGDDPIGDAGMGRGLLFLKWLLEGVFLPGFDEFNQDPLLPDDLDLRTQIHSRLAARRDAFEIEGYEWGVLQEYAMLKKSNHLRMALQTSIAGRENVLPDYVDASDEAAMKNAGKAAIRAVLAKLVTVRRPEVFATTPTQFQAEPAFRTFEDFVGALARANAPNVVLTLGEIDDYLAAKVSDYPTFDRIRRRPGGVDGFLQSAFDYMQTVVQQPTAQGYETYLDSLPRQGLVYEFNTRTGNASALDHGVPSPDGPGNPGRPGRADYLGRGDPATAEYGFIVTLQKRGYGPAAAGPVNVLLESPEVAPLIAGPLTIPPDRNTLVINKLNGSTRPFFTVLRPIEFGVTQDHTFFLTGEALRQDTFTANNAVTFESRFLPVQSGAVLPPRFTPPAPAQRTRWVFRGMRLSDEAEAVVEAEQLSQGVIESPAVFNGFDVEAEITKAADNLDMSQETDFDEADAVGWSREQRAALAHTGFLNARAPGVSTSENISFPLTSVLVLGLIPPEKAWLIAAEVPIDQGIEYLPAANGAQRRINADEGNEVVYLRSLRFKQAHIFQIVIPPGRDALPTDKVLLHKASFQGQP